MIGKHLSHYLIESELGRGGMGIVYRAKDTKLDRTVAIKVLPSAALASDDDRARFYREAKAAAALTHPHIAIIHGVDEVVPEGAPHGTEPSPFIAMEFIDGQTLEDRIKVGPLELDEAVRIAGEIASALKLAHENEIVHRDIKAANVMLAKDGSAKVLDFGLAQTAQSTKLTRLGSTLGTAAYMSPEQARGEAVDRRSDLWSLGVVLYEMISGRPPFSTEYEQAALYSILNEQQDPLTALRTGVPMNLEWIVNKCLAKQADDRYQSASDLIVDLRNLDLSSSSVSGVSQISSASMPEIVAATADYPPVAATPQPAGKKSIGALVAAVSVALAFGLLGGYLMSRETPDAAPLTRVTIDLPGMSGVRFFTLSPTREYAAFVAIGTESGTGIFLRDMASGDISYIDGTEDAAGLGGREIQFSPDGSRIAFTHGVNGGISTVVVPAGLPERQTDKGRLSFWEDDNLLVFVNDQPGGLTYRKTIGGGDSVLVELDHGELEENYVTNWKTRIRESGIAFGHQLARGADIQNQTSWLVRGRIEDGNIVERMESPIMNPEYVHGGFLVYQQRNDTGTLVVRPIDPETGSFLGPPRQVLEDEATRWGQFSISVDGDLFYRESDGGVSDGSRQLYFIDLESQAAEIVPLIIPSGSDIGDISFSPDGKQLALSLEKEDEGVDTVIYDLEETTLTQITFGVQARSPVWSEDGEWIYYSVANDSSTAVYRQSPNALAIPELVVENAFLNDISPDGTRLVFNSPDPMNPVQVNLMMLDIVSSTTTELDTSEGFQGRAQFSPDGDYLAYVHFDLGFELRVMSLDGFRMMVVPNVGGLIPRWAADGKSIYLSDESTIQIPVQTSPSFAVLASPTILFGTLRPQGFDVSPDGMTAVTTGTSVFFGATGSEELGSQITWLQNWSAHLSREFTR